jgi:hypothetical protein
VIVNAMLFNNEYDLLSFRLKYYGDLINKFVLLTSDVTFSGSPKLGFDPKFDLNGKNIEILMLDTEQFQESHFRERWPIEFASRIQLIDYVASSFPDAVIIHTDADEFPSVEQIFTIASEGSLNYGTVPLKTHYRRGNWTSLGINKISSAVSCFTSVKWLTGELINTRGRYVGGETIRGETGSHFSYLDMGPNEVNLKMTSFSHSEFDLGPALMNSLIPLADDYVVDHLGRAREATLGLLKVEKTVELNSVQLAALQFRENWFDFNSPKYGLVSRIAASIFITNRITTPDPGMSFPISRRQKIESIIGFFWRRITRKLQKLIKSRVKIWQA